jgi:hypothetical protein
MALHRRIGLFVLAAVAWTTASGWSAQTLPAPSGLFEGSYAGSYRIPENDLLVNVTVTLKRIESRVQMEWTEAVTSSGKAPERRTFSFAGIVRDTQLRFSTPPLSLFPGITYTAVRLGEELFVHLRLFSHPTGFFTDQACEACEDVVKEIKLVKRPPASGRAAAGRE